MFHRFIIGIGGLSVRVCGVVLGIGGIKDHMESRSVFCVMLEVVVGREQSVQMPLCWSVCLVFNLYLRVQSVWVCWKPPLSLSSCSARQKCWKTSLPEMQQTPVCQCTFVGIVCSSINLERGYDKSLNEFLYFHWFVLFFSPPYSVLWHTHNEEKGGILVIMWLLNREQAFGVFILIHSFSSAMCVVVTHNNTVNSSDKT